ncbi:unnamed protein product [Cuscuta campestris]|uniref:Uncharacterized protein n=1 Tax=Cuscuta campestris TaxID=132261 RepID=A0A484L3B5_9ASTE|nr:unnamed protein product [Cuscuta campestris]
MGGFEESKVNTTLGFIFKEEVVMVAIDHPRLPDGAFPENAIVPHPHLLVAISGGSKDCRKEFLHYLQKKCNEHEREVGRKASAEEATKWMCGLVSRNLPRRDDDGLPKLIFAGCETSYSGDDLPKGILIAGWDKELGPSLFQVDAEGKIWKQPLCSAGCGSAGLFLITWPHKHMFMDDAVKMAEGALCLSVYPYREACECVTVFQVGVEGVKLVIFNRDIGEWQKQHSGKS